VALVSVPDPSPYRSDYFFILYRNSLVPALHAMACVAGFMAGSVAACSNGLQRLVAARARPRGPAGDRRSPRHLAGAVAGRSAAPCAARAVRAVRPARRLQPPRRLARTAATFITCAIAVPVLLAAAAVEVWLTSQLLYFLK
jgi:hypothetical protein